MIRSTKEEREYQINTVEKQHQRFESEGADVLSGVQNAAVHNDNIFAQLMEATKYCTLGQISAALYEVGGQYRRNM